LFNLLSKNFRGLLLGEIIYKTLIKFFLLIIIIWFVKDSFDEKFLWILSALSFFFFIVHPAYLSYQNFIEANRNIVISTLCSSCKHFDESAILCTKYDKHPTETYIPCEGSDWEPK
jgi:hypothetical protein